MQKKENLTLMDDHVLLVEYLEEHPLLLSRPGEEATLFSVLAAARACADKCGSSLADRGRFKAWLAADACPAACQACLA